MMSRWNVFAWISRWVSAPRRLKALEQELNELKLAEARLLCLVEATNAIVWGATELGGTIGTRSWFEFTGQTAEEHAGWGWLDSVHPDDRERVRRVWQNAWDSRSWYKVEYRLRKSQGDYADVLSRGIPLPTSDGTLTEWIGALQDVTALRRSEREAAERLRQLEETQQKLLAQERLAAVGELSAVVAHEVRNPLGVIFNALTVLNREQKHPLLDVIGEEADRLNRIVADLLDFARPCEARLSADESISTVIQQALQSMDLARRLITVTVELSPEADNLPMDSRLIRQLLNNLFENAVQAMPGGGRLDIRTRPHGSSLELLVADTGPGVPKEVQDKIFTPFFTTKATGTGLGLAVVKRIAESHGGTVVLGNGRAGGCEFRVRFPMLFATSVPADQAGGSLA
jgi:PAS domain S-box-containing protein